MSYRPYDAIIAQAQASNSNLTVDILNDTGLTIANLTPVAVDDDGRLSLIDVSDDNTILSIAGVTSAAILDGSSGPVALTGRILNTGIGFAHGDYLYVSKTGTLINQIPEVGINGFVVGDAVIRVGVVVRNATTPANKDILVKMQLVGKL